MTTKEAIKTLLAADYNLSYAIGYAANTKEFDADVFDALVNARQRLEEVVFTLCDELPDHIADPGKKGATLPDGTPTKSKEAEAVRETARCPECGLIALPILGSPFKWRCETHGEFFVYPGKPPKSGEGEK